MMKIKNAQVRIIKGRCDKQRGAHRIVGVISDAQADESKVRRACRNVLESARKERAGAIVLSVSRSRRKMLPLKAIAKIMAQEVLRYLNETKGGAQEIIICAQDNPTYAVFSKHILGYLDYIVNKLKSPFVTVDAIIKVGEGIVLIKRSNPPYGWALPGGFVDYGESLERAVKREAKEETGLCVFDLKQFHTYSDPARDPRFHTIGTVFTAKAQGRPKAGDDAAAAKIVKISRIGKLDFAFDHKKILLDYLARLPGGRTGKIF